MRKRESEVEEQAHTNWDNRGGGPHLLEREEIAVSHDPNRQFMGIEFGDPIILSSAAGFILGGDRSDDLAGGFDLVFEGSDEGPWATLIPQEVAEAFLGLGDDQLDGIAKQWCEIEEFYGSVTPDTCRQNLIWLRAAFRRFKDVGVTPHLWMTL